MSTTVEATTQAEKPPGATVETETSTLAELTPDRRPDDAEKQEAAPLPVDPGEAFPDGGLRAWATVVGAWLAGKSNIPLLDCTKDNADLRLVFATFGYANTFGAYQAYYQFEGYPTQSASNISWIGSVQFCLQFALGAVSGVLYDKGYFYHLMVAGGVIYIVS